MSIELAQAVMDRSKALGPDKSILIIYAFHADDETGICWPSNETVAKKSGYNEKTVQRAKAHLLNIGELKLLQGGNTVGRSRKTDTLQVMLTPDRQSPDCESPVPRTVSPPTPDCESPVPRTVSTPQSSSESSLNGREAHSRHRTPKKKESEKEVKPEKDVPRPGIGPFVEFGKRHAISEQDCQDQFEIWEAAGWRDGNGKPIRSWKGTLVSFHKIKNLPSDKRSRTGGSGKPAARKGFCNL